MYGPLSYNYIDDPVTVTPRVYLVETYRLSSFLGVYGAGKTIKTFSLFPGEKTKISVKTYAKRETDAKDASSILDSFTQRAQTILKIQSKMKFRIRKTMIKALNITPRLKLAHHGVSVVQK